MKAPAKNVNELSNKLSSTTAAPDAVQDAMSARLHNSASQHRSRIPSGRLNLPLGDSMNQPGVDPPPYGINDHLNLNVDNSTDNNESDEGRGAGDDDDDEEDDDDDDDDENDTGIQNTDTNNSLANRLDDDASDTSIDPNTGEEILKKKSKACKRCHSLKVKCTPLDVSADDYDTCKRCSLKGIECEYNIIIKKVKKTVNMSKSMKLRLKIEEIEKLKTELLEKNKLIEKLQSTSHKDGIIEKSAEISQKEKLVFYSKEIHELEVLEKHSNDTTKDTTPDNLDFISCSERRVEICQSQMPSLDIIGMGLLTTDQCTRLVNTFVTKIHARFPFTELPKNLSVEYLKINAPLLLVIMCYIALIADKSFEIPSETQLQLECLIGQSLSSEILLIGNKSFQLLKNTLIYSFWYVAPELFHHRRYHLFTSLCVSLSHDLGISGRPYFFYNKGDGSIKKTSIVNDEKNIDLKGLVLVVYTLYMSISLFLKRVIFLEWNSYFEECCQVLEKSDKREYKLIVLYAKINHSMETMYNSFHRSGENLTVYELSSNKTKLQIQEYLKILQNIKQQITANFDQKSFDYNCLMAYLYSAQAYLFEPAVQTLIKSKENVTKEYKDLFFTSLNEICEACILSLNHFNQLSIEDLSVNPLFHTSRILYTSGMLLRIRYLSLTIPKTCTAKMFTEDAIPSIRALMYKIDESSKLYPKNHFLKKIKVVLNLFIHTCLTQWHSSYKILYKEIKRVDPTFYDAKLEQSLGLSEKAETYNFAPQTNSKRTAKTKTSPQKKAKTKNTAYAMPGNAASFIKMRNSESLPAMKLPPIKQYQLTTRDINNDLTVNENKNNPNITPNHLNININSPADLQNQTNMNNLPQFNNYAPHMSSSLSANYFNPYQEPNANSASLRHHSSITNNFSPIPQLNMTSNHISSDFLTPTTIQDPSSATSAVPPLMDMQYTAFNDEFWSDLFFGEGGNGVGAGGGYGIDDSDTTPNSNSAFNS